MPPFRGAASGTADAGATVTGPTGAFGDTPQARRWFTRATVAVLVLLSVGAMVGDATAPTLLLRRPLLLAGLSPRARNLLLVARVVHPVALVAVGVGRRLLPALLLYPLGVLHGDAALAWLDQRSPTAARMTRAIERWFGWWPARIVVLFPGGLTAYLAGRGVNGTAGQERCARAMTLARYLVLAGASLLLRLLLMVWLGETLAGPLDRLLDFVRRYQWQLTGLTMTFVVVHVVRQRRRKPSASSAAAHPAE